MINFPSEVVDPSFALLWIGLKKLEIFPLGLVSGAVSSLIALLCTVVKTPVSILTSLLSFTFLAGDLRLSSLLSSALLQTPGGPGHGGGG